MGACGSHEEAAGFTKSGCATEPPTRSTSFASTSGSSGEWARRKVRTSSARLSESAPKRSTKEKRDHELVWQSVQDCTLLGALRGRQLDEMIEVMEIAPMKPGERRSLSDCLVVVLEGELQVEGLGGRPERFGPGSVLGEVGLLHATKLQPVACATKASRVSHLTRKAYTHAVEFTRQAQIMSNLKLLDSIPLFDKLSVNERLKISDACELQTYVLDQPIVREGEPGQTFYIVRSGEAEVVRRDPDAFKPKRIDYKYTGDWFGECALLDSAPRNATVVSKKHCTEVLAIDQTVFKMLLGPLSEIQSRTEMACQLLMLVTVPLFSELTAEVRRQLQSKLQLERIAPGEYIFEQGDEGHKLYIIQAGRVSVHCRLGDDAERTQIDLLGAGQYFGERALLKCDPRMASARAEGKSGQDVALFSLTKGDFDALGLQETVGWSRRWEQEDTRDVDMLDVLKPMGSGAFGTAWLVQHRETKQTYALKAMDKARCLRGDWQAVIMREKDVLASIPPHAHIVTLLNTFQDASTLYMLMDLAPGGELYQLLVQHEAFSAFQARFYGGCVVLGLEHLHAQGVVFRDLKPENLLLDKRGYVKIIDFGFAKRVQPGTKTFTLCGTPYYLAPEMILHSGHDKARPPRDPRARLCPGDWRVPANDPMPFSSVGRRSTGGRLACSSSRCSTGGRPSAATTSSRCTARCPASSTSAHTPSPPRSARCSRCSSSTTRCSGSATCATARRT